MVGCSLAAPQSLTRAEKTGLEQRLLQDVLAGADDGVLEADKGDREHAVRDAHAGHQDLRAADSGLIDDDWDPARGAVAQSEPHEQWRQDGPVEGGVAQEPGESVGAGLFGLVDGQRAGQGRTITTSPCVRSLSARVFTPSPTPPRLFTHHPRRPRRLTRARQGLRQGFMNSPG